MANFREVLFGSFKSDSINIELECFINEFEEISIKIENTDTEHDFNCQIISLDKSTAIKLSKVLRREINKIDSDE